MTKERSRLIKKLDALFSRRIKERDGHTCQRCGKQHEEKSRGLHNSHFWKRGYMGTRWEPLNCKALCFSCHRRWEGDKQGEYKDFMLKRIGEEDYAKLEVKARGITKFSVSDLRLMYQVMKGAQNGSSE
jgi:5-methylcytosine-specific restriction endonuclease McrA